MCTVLLDYCYNQIQKESYREVYDRGEEDAGETNPDPAEGSCLHIGQDNPETKELYLTVSYQMISFKI